MKAQKRINSLVIVEVIVAFWAMVELAMVIH